MGLVSPKYFQATHLMSIYIHIYINATNNINCNRIMIYLTNNYIPRTSCCNIMCYEESLLKPEVITQSRPGRRGGSGGSNEPPRSSWSSAKLCQKCRNTQARVAPAYARLGCFIFTRHALARAAPAYARLGCFIFTRHALARARESTAVFVGLVQQESFF